MNTGIVSVRYARALLEYSREEGVQDAMYNSMQLLLKTIMQLDELTNVLLSPSLSDADKVDLLCNAVPDAPLQFRRFAQLVIKKGRESFLRYIAYAYISLYRQEEGILQVKLTTAIPVDEELSQRIAQLMAKNTPDVGAIQSQLAQAQAAAQQAELRSAAMMQAVSLGIDANTIPYVLKLADFSQATGQDGKISDEALKAALNKVLEDVPALKPQTSAAAGFVQLGAPGTGSGGTQNTDQQAMLSNIFGIKKK